MFLSQYFLPTTKEIPSDVKIVSHQLMVRAGLIKQLAAGLYSWLPLGLKVLKNIESIIRYEMNNIGANEVLLPHVQPVSIWQQSGRLDGKTDLNDQMFSFKDKAENSFILAPTAEEAITHLFKESVQSYKDVNKILYQISWKFRDEIRPRFGVMRSREFFMKDAYSFDFDEESSIKTYAKIFNAYLKIFQKLGIQAIPVLASTGAMGGSYSHEFHILADNGESIIYYEKELENALNQEGFDLKKLEKFYAKEEEKHDLTAEQIKGKDIKSHRSIEAGHLFYLGQKYSKSMNCQYQSKDGKLNYPEMGCYGIGISRLIGAIIEHSHDDKGIIWPESIAPFKVAILNLAENNDNCRDIAMSLYNALCEKNIEVLFNDLKLGVGVKFANMDLIGIPWQVIIGNRYKKESLLELKNRKTGEIKAFTLDELIKLFTS